MTPEEEDHIAPAFLAFSYGCFFVALGLSLSLLVSCCCRRVRSMRLCLAVSLAWTLPAILWFAYSPLSVCSPRIVYSYPHNATRSGSAWEGYWCARPCSDSELYEPADADALASIVAAASHVRVLGGGHSGTDLQCATAGGATISTEGLCRFDGIDARGIATFGAGCTVLRAQQHLVPLGRQLKGYGTITPQHLGGAISTSLHGQHTQAFADHLRGLTAILADGSRLVVSEDDPHLWAWPGSMGMLGAIVEVRLQTWALEFVECTSVEGQDEAALLKALTSDEVVGFEAKRFLDTDEPYTIRTCRSVTDEAVVEAQGEVEVRSKEDMGIGFLADNAGLGALLLLGRSLTDWEFTQHTLLDRINTARSREGVVATVNDYRLSVSYHPYFDKEYSVPVARCHEALEAIGDLHPRHTVHAYLRRVDATRGWLTWAAEDSCAIRLEHFDFGRLDVVSFETEFRETVETVVLAHGGSGHYGKVWFRNASLLLQNSPRYDAFEAYRASLDPTGKFQNDYTREMRGAGARTTPVIPTELTTRAVVWRTAVWTVLVATVLASALPWRGGSILPKRAAVVDSATLLRMPEPTPPTTSVPRREQEMARIRDQRGGRV